MRKKLTNERASIRGPFIEYECSECGTVVQENAPRNVERLASLISDKHANPSARLCASCWSPRAAEKEEAA